jgi:hypothetical protein
MTEQLKTSLLSEGMRRLYDYWKGKSNDGHLPRREDIDPGALPDLLPNIFLVDIEETPRRYRVRLAGTAVAECFGEDMTGKTIDSLDLGKDRSAILGLYDQAAQYGEPSYDRHQFWTKAYGQHLSYERMLLPLSSDGKHIDKLLGCAFKVPLKSDAPAPQ